MTFRIVDPLVQRYQTIIAEQQVQVLKREINQLVPTLKRKYLYLNTEFLVPMQQLSQVELGRINSGAC